jgi:hypothetical protein
VTSVKLAHTLSNNFFLRGFSISPTKTETIITDEYGQSHFIYQRYIFSGVRQYIGEKLLLKSFFLKLTIKTSLSTPLKKLREEK